MAVKITRRYPQNRPLQAGNGGLWVKLNTLLKIKGWAQRRRRRTEKKKIIQLGGKKCSDWKKKKISQLVGWGRAGEKVGKEKGRPRDLPTRVK